MSRIPSSGGTLGACTPFPMGPGGLCSGHICSEFAGLSTGAGAEPGQQLLVFGGNEAMGSGCISQLSSLGITLTRTLKGVLQHPKKDENPVCQTTSARRKMQDRLVLWEVRFSCWRRGSAFPPYPAVSSWLPQSNFLPHCLDFCRGE